MTDAPLDLSTPLRAGSTRVATPNFLYLGASKAGSTWIYDLLNHHPDVFMAAGKGLYYFDGHYDYGIDWYLSHFRRADTQKVVGEVSHSYLYSRESAARIAALNPAMKLMVCVREPAERAFSAYLDGVKNDGFDDGMTFEQALQADLSIIDRGRYVTHLRPFVEVFGRERIHIGVFDQLAADPRAFAADLFDFLGVARIELAPKLLKKMLPAARPRSKRLVRLSKTASKAAQRLGLRRLRGRVKTSRWIRSALYKPYQSNDKPQMAEETRLRLRELYHPEVAEIDRVFGLSLTRIWNYDPAAPNSAS